MKIKRENLINKIIDSVILICFGIAFGYFWAYQALV